MNIMVNKKSMSIALRAQALALFEADLPMDYIRSKTGLAQSTIYIVYDRLQEIDRGLRP